MSNEDITWLEISRQAIKYNLNQFKKIIKGKSQILAVVKSNAYGHGLVEMAKIAKLNGIKWLGTVNLDEALLLRAHNIKGRILVLSYYDPKKLLTVIKNNITLTVYSYNAAKKLNQIGKKTNTKVKIHLKIDTGTSRLGIDSLISLTIIKKINKLKNIGIEGIFSHFADAENPNQVMTEMQLNKFNTLLKLLNENNIKIPIKHFACSAATILNKKSHYDLVRIGISMYGLWSIENNKKDYLKYNLKPALSWYTKIIQLKEILPDNYIGYGSSYKVTRKIKLAIIPIGYWEGYDRKLSNIGEVIINDIKCKIRGRICMNLTMIDVTNVPKVKIGDKVTLIGGRKKTNISVDDIAKHINTINYEVVTRINPLIKRIYIK